MRPRPANNEDAREESWVISRLPEPVPPIAQVLISRDSRGSLDRKSLIKSAPEMAFSRRKMADHGSWEDWGELFREILMEIIYF